jgi:hypothetical protein
MKEQRLVLRWQGRERNPTLNRAGDMTVHYPDRAGYAVGRMLLDALPDTLLRQIQDAGYDVSTLRISICRISASASAQALGGGDGGRG